MVRLNFIFNKMKERIKRFFDSRFLKIKEINEKYAVPRVKMTPMVRYTLVFLRFYLLFLVGILIYKFITILK
jgi:hypothetical protein